MTVDDSKPIRGCLLRKERRSCSFLKTRFGVADKLGARKARHLGSAGKILIHDARRAIKNTSSLGLCVLCVSVVNESPLEMLKGRTANFAF